MTQRKLNSWVGLNQHQRDLVCDALAKLVLREIEQAKKAIKNKSYFGSTIELADAGDWALVLSDIASGTISNLQMLKDRVKGLHAGDEHICCHLLAQLENKPAQSAGAASTKK